jgi:hypothetical protein
MITMPEHSENILRNEVDSHCALIAQSGLRNDEEALGESHCALRCAMSFPVIAHSLRNCADFPFESENFPGAGGHIEKGPPQAFAVRRAAQN